MSVSCKVYVVGPNFDGLQDWPEKIAACEAFKKDICDLALQRNETVFFHWHMSNVDGSPPLGGAPSFHLECRQDFFSEVRRLKTFGYAHEETFYKSFRAQIAGPIDQSDLKTVYVKTENPANPRWNMFSVEMDLQKLAYQCGQIGNIHIYDVDVLSRRIRFLSPDCLDNNIMQLGNCTFITPSRNQITKPADLHKHQL